MARQGKGDRQPPGFEALAPTLGTARLNTAWPGTATPGEVGRGATRRGTRAGLTSALVSPLQSTHLGHVSLAPGGDHARQEPPQHHIRGLRVGPPATTPQAHRRPTRRGPMRPLQGPDVPGRSPHPPRGPRAHEQGSGPASGRTQPRLLQHERGRTHRQRDASSTTPRHRAPEPAPHHEATHLTRMVSWTGRALVHVGTLTLATIGALMVIVLIMIVVMLIIM